MDANLRTWHRFAWFLVAYTLVVILVGAYVRATVSGAGCGDHWPLCHGQVVPDAQSEKTLIEFTHRVTSGLAWFLTLVLALGCRKIRPANRYAWWSLVFMTTEGLIGASIVLLELVALDQSKARAVWMVLHLLNTFALLYTLCRTAKMTRPSVAQHRNGSAVKYYGASGSPSERLEEEPVPQASLPRVKSPHTSARGLELRYGKNDSTSRLGGANTQANWWVPASILISAATGAVAALGDTLWLHAADANPDLLSKSGQEIFALRVWHPAVALLTTAIIWTQTRPPARTPIRVVLVLQVLVGALNIVLLVPTWAQLLHLALADTLWLLWTYHLPHPQTGQHIFPAPAPSTPPTIVPHQSS